MDALVLAVVNELRVTFVSIKTFVRWVFPITSFFTYVNDQSHIPSCHLCMCIFMSWVSHLHMKSYRAAIGREVEESDICLSYSSSLHNLHLEKNKKAEPNFSLPLHIPRFSILHISTPLRT